jgi:tetratricopeptide (TPR) repeat protein
MLQPESNSYVDLCYLCIGYYHQEKEHFKQAEEYYQKALEYDKALPANDNSRISQVLLYFSGLYYRMGDYAKALENAQRIIDLNDTINHDNRGFVRYAYGQIAQTYSEQGKYEDALKYFQLAMEATELSSDNKRETALLFSNYGVLLRRLNKNDQAVEMLQKALEIDLQLYGKNHPTVGRAYGNIANIYMSKGEYATAKEYMQKSLDILSRVYGTNNMNIASLYGNMGALSAHQEKWNETLSYYTKAMDISERLLGPSHPQTALMYHGVGMAYVKLGETAKGLGYMEKALTIAKEKLGENHPYVKEMMKDRENIKE